MAKSNSMSTPKIPDSPEKQNELRRGKKAAKRRASGSDTSINPTRQKSGRAPKIHRTVLLGATLSYQEIVARQRKAAFHKEQVILALAHPEYTDLREGSPARKVAEFIIRTFESTHSLKEAAESVRDIVKDDPKVTDGAFNKGKASARNALNASYAILTGPGATATAATPAQPAATTPAPEPALV